jgi:hypothetical protein
MPRAQQIAAVVIAAFIVVCVLVALLQRTW